MLHYIHNIVLKKYKKKDKKIIIKEQKYFHDGDDFKGDVWSKTTIPKEIALLSKMWQDDESLISSRHRFSKNGFSTKKKQATLPTKTTQDKRQKTYRPSLTPNRKTLTALTHNTPHKQHTTLHTNRKCANGDMI